MQRFFTLASHLSLALFLLAPCMAVAQSEAKATETKDTAKKEPVKKDSEKKKAKKSLQEFKIAKGKFILQAPGEWKKIKPKVSMIEHEFQIPSAKDDKAKGRFTIMAASGPIQGNIARWKGQFVAPKGSSIDDKTEIKKKKVAGQTIHVVKISGTFKNKPKGFFGPVVLEKDYMMLAAILVTEDSGKYFFKFYGPKKSIAAQEKSFMKMLDGLKAK